MTLIKLLLQGDVCHYSSSVFNDGEIASILPLFSTIFRLFAVPQYEPAREKMHDTLSPLLHMVCSNDIFEFTIFFEDTIQLLRDTIIVFATYYENPKEYVIILLVYKNIVQHSSSISMNTTYLN